LTYVELDGTASKLTGYTGKLIHHRIIKII
jgi:hypothetical protein